MVEQRCTTYCLPTEQRSTVSADSELMETRRTKSVESRPANPSTGMVLAAIKSLMKTRNTLHC